MTTRTMIMYRLHNNSDNGNVGSVNNVLLLIRLDPTGLYPMYLKRASNVRDRVPDSNLHSFNSIYIYYIRWQVRHTILPTTPKYIHPLLILASFVLLQPIIITQDVLSQLDLDYNGFILRMSRYENRPEAKRGVTKSYVDDPPSLASLIAAVRKFLISVQVSELDGLSIGRLPARYPMTLSVFIQGLGETLPMRYSQKRCGLRSSAYNIEGMCVLIVVSEEFEDCL
ncbi:hypothetical protein GGR51DRAFT_407700 [Nemania sp. FL0031]|nr:hypothetical protein GGR51DRAFT_407700 [Nemania sp. FL0031]